MSSQETLKSYFQPSGRSYSRRWQEEYCQTRAPDIYSLVIAESRVDSDFSTKVWALINSQNFNPICTTCGKIHHIHWKEVWQETCSKECSHKSPGRRARISVSQKKVSLKAKETRKATMIQKYGVEYNSQRPEIVSVIQEKMSERQIPPAARVLLEDKAWMTEQHVSKRLAVTKIAAEIGVYYTTVQEYLKKHEIPYTPGVGCGGNRSKAEIDVENFLRGYVEVIPTYRLPSGKSLDIFIPSLNVGIEYNGLYWHSDNALEGPVNPKKHLNKTEECENLGIRLIHINEDEWIFQRELVESFLRNIIGKSENKSFARKCELREVPSHEAKAFFDASHFRGAARASITLGLYLNDGSLVQACSFAKARFTKKYDWELIRFATKKGHTIVGGFSKLLKAFRATNSGSLMTYCDRMKSQGGVYLASGMIQEKSTTPGYWWVVDGRLHNRFLFQKGKLGGFLKEFDVTLSEDQNMYRAGFRKFWDCGNLVFVLY